MYNPFRKTVDKGAFCVIDDEEHVEAMCIAILGAGRYVSVDVEWTVNCPIALVQFHCPGRYAYLLRVCKHGIRTSNLAKRLVKQVLQFPGLVKIFHDCREDIQRLYQWCRAQTFPIFDLQICSQLLQEHRQISFQQLVSDYVKLDYRKIQGVATSDWTQPGLGWNQKLYGAEDVIYSTDLYEFMAARIDNQRCSDDKEMWVAMIEDTMQLTHSGWISGNTTNVPDHMKHPDRLW